MTEATRLVLVLTMTVELPSHLRDAVNGMPEHSYGVAKVTIALRDGRLISDVYIGWGIDILKIGSSRDISFRSEDVVAVRHQD